MQTLTFCALKWQRKQLSPHAHSTTWKTCQRSSANLFTFSQHETKTLWKFTPSTFFTRFPQLFPWKKLIKIPSLQQTALNWNGRESLIVNLWSVEPHVKLCEAIKLEVKVIARKSFSNHLNYCVDWGSRLWVEIKMNKMLQMSMKNHSWIILSHQEMNSNKSFNE